MSMRANNCPCCGGSILRHVRQSEVYWFCKTCFLEVPSLRSTQMSKIEARTRISTAFTSSAIDS